MIEIRGVRDFNAEHIFDCGQCFRWNREEDGSYTGVAGEYIANIRYDSGTVYIDGSGSEEFWSDYLDLGRDYGKIKEKLSEDDEIIGAAIEYGSGIRLLNQDRWETLISFIISQNNNIPRIKGCIEKLCAMFGKPIGTFRGKEYFSFPERERLAGLSEEDLEPARLGYRARYIVETAKADIDLEKASELDTPSLYRYLLSLTGVGPKVANCILLFGFSRYDSFPVDVWVRRVMNRLYGFDEKDMKGMTRFAEEKFGSLGGFAQQYLFYYIRIQEES